MFEHKQKFHRSRLARNFARENSQLRKSKHGSKQRIMHSMKRKYTRKEDFIELISIHNKEVKIHRKEKIVKTRPHGKKTLSN